MSSAPTEQPCRRCGEPEIALVVRTEPLCVECFTRYIHSKVIKRMEGFRARNSKPDQQRKLLLPVSMGVSSVTLLHILDRQLESQQERSGRTGFTLHILFVTDESHSNADEPMASKKALLQKNYPSYEYSVTSLEKLFTPAPRANAVDSEESNNQSDLNQLLSHFPSVTAQTDVLSLLRTRAIVSFAASQGCEAVLWGHSTTRLAEQVLSETAKGRGFSLPLHVADGPSPFGMAFYYPMRDLLKKELVSHAQLASPPLMPLLDENDLLPTEAAPSSKNTSIDDLMKHYFESVEENYPSIVSNVVRTSSRLQAKFSDSGAACKLCRLPVSSEQLGTHGWSGEQGDDSDSMVDGWELCYGCTRSVPASAVPFLP